MVVAVDHALADHILHIQVIRHGAHHVRPEPFAFLQRQFDELAAGDVGDAQDHRFIVFRAFRQTQHQPQVLVIAGGVLEPDFQFKLFLLVEQRFQHLVADSAAVQRVAVDQQFPGLIGGVDVEQLQRDLVDLGNAQRLQQLLALLRDGQPRLQLIVALHLALAEYILEAGHVEHAQRNAGAFENLLIAPTTFMQLALTPAHVQQDDKRQHGKGQAQQAFADEGRQQFFEYTLAIEQPAQLPVAAAQRNGQYAVAQVILGQRAGVDQWQRFIAADDLVVEAVFHQPLWTAVGFVQFGQGREKCRFETQGPIATGAAAGLMQ
ncbi:hypothetical protein D3C72_1195270 [compost metagenome]